MSSTLSFEQYNLVLRTLGPNDSYHQYLENTKANPESRFVNFITSNFHGKKFSFVDIGANIGVTSLLLSRHFPKVTIYSIEPGPTVFKILEDNLKSNEAFNCKAYNIAISNKSGQITFEENSAYGHINLTESTNAQLSDVHVSTLDEFFEDISDSQNNEYLIKIDVEGFEPQVFDGFKKNIPDKVCLYFEFNSWALVTYAKNNPVDFLKDLLKDDWRIFKFKTENELVQIVTEEDVLALAYENMVLGDCVSDLIAVPESFALVTSFPFIQKENVDEYSELEQFITQPMPSEYSSALLKANHKRLDCFKKCVSALSSLFK